MIYRFLNLVFILSVMSDALFGYTSVTNVRYEGGISIFGRVAEADIKLEENLDTNEYKMDVKAHSIGVVKVLTSNREDEFISEGRIEGDKYIPYKFVRKIIKNNYVEEIVYLFDYKNKKVSKQTNKTEDVEESSYDIIKMKKIVDVKTIKSTNLEYIDLKENDYISLFLNMSANNLQTGSVDYIDKKDSDNVMLISKTIFEVSKSDGDEIYRINFSKDKSMFFDKAVALDIALYGDAYLKKISEKKTIIN